MTCQDCAGRLTKPNYAIYTAKCPGCQAAMLDMSPAVHAHVANMKRFGNRHDRAQYVEAVKKSSGDEMAESVKRMYLAWWDTKHA